MIISQSSDAILSLYWETYYQMARRGNYRNIGLTSTDSHGNNLSRFTHYAVTGEPYQDGQVFQSYFPRFMIEPPSALTPLGDISAPTAFTSVQVNGATVSSNHATSGFRVDWRRGRIIFDSPQSTSLNVSGEFPALEVALIMPGDSFNRETVVDEEHWLNSPHTYSSPQVSNPYELPWPVVVLRRLQGQPKSLSLGGAIKENYQAWSMDIYSFRQTQVDSVVEAIKTMQDTSIPLIDFSQAGTSPELWDGSRNPSYSGWSVVRAADHLRHSYMYIRSVQERYFPVLQRKVRARLLIEGAFVT